MDDKNESQNSIPTSKVARATRFVKTGVKVGGNYLKHYAQKVMNGEANQEDLDRANAEDIYETLSELKGSALKVAQMLSMDKNMLPAAYTEKFTQAQYSAPPLSFPLVVKTFQTYFQKSPNEMFETFSKEAFNAASIGQVHQATLKGKKLAVKVQYPGVAGSISSDLKMVKPFASRLLQLDERDLEVYMGEVEKMLIQETDYKLELRRSQQISEACAHLQNLIFAKYYPEFSCERILTMDWLEGTHLDKFLANQPSQEIKNRIGQALWDFYDYQMHVIKTVHADPHPGNFLFGEQGTVGVLDFGCVKEIPADYYDIHFGVLDHTILTDEQRMFKLFYEIGFLFEEDSAHEKEIFSQIFKTMCELTTRPFLEKTFDFGNKNYFQEMMNFGESVSKMPEFKTAKRPRGSKEALYLNRTYFGLYAMLHQLEAQIETRTAFSPKK